MGFDQPEQKKLRRTLIKHPITSLPCSSKMKPVEPLLTEKSIVTEFSSVSFNADVLSPILLDHRNNFLITLMRLRLGLLNEDIADRLNEDIADRLNEDIADRLNEDIADRLNEDIADRFGILKSLCSNIFTAFIKIVAYILGNAIIVWLPMTWSDYKRHNTVNVLIGIAPNGYITFLSKFYGGRASDKFITSGSGFFDLLLERADEVMADRVQIREELLFCYCSLLVPACARVKSQMTANECEKTTDVANLRIHIERAINRIMPFRKIKNLLPISKLHHMDNITLSCAALCNLKPALVKNNSSLKV
ncbi:uncharacterized protein LOC136086113 [Hydra vulgaris]|uniref:Uncharacterized protein LOC136086113 n=1 Tax=Hydra vulgaris TaxID=6087 RepID=A0ABM4CRF5_HYDVU